MGEITTLNVDQLVEQMQDTSSPVMLQYYKGLKNRTLIINEAITESIIECAVLPLLEWDNDGTGKDIKIYLSSGGGSTYNGLTLCSIIDKLKTKTEVITFSYAMSMGALILMAGYDNPNVTKKCYPFTVGLIHGGSQLFEGTLSQARDYWSFNEKYEVKIKDYVLTHSKITDSEYEKMQKTEWYMTAEDMIKHGLVDEIL
jgi:ATP-dependent Clp endopeptidase proteolytic subunit ClpP